MLPTCLLFVVEDDPAVVEMLREIVAEHGLGRVVGVADNGQSAEEAILEAQPDVVVIDLLLPRQDGLKTIRNLRGRGFGGAFIMLSQVMDKEMVGGAYRAGVEFFIHKPINPFEVRSVIEKVAVSHRLQHVLQQVHHTLLPLSGLGSAYSRGLDNQDQKSGRQARELLGDLGILGEAGAPDLVALARMTVTREIRLLPGTQLKEIYEALGRRWAATGGGESASPAAIEQRVRRAAQAALRHLASIGLEDFGDSRFERLAGRFFDFAEVRAEMNHLRRNSGHSGRVNLKKFLEAFVLEAGA